MQKVLHVAYNRAIKNTYFHLINNRKNYIKLESVIKARFKKFLLQENIQKIEKKL